MMDEHSRFRIGARYPSIVLQLVAKFCTPPRRGDVEGAHGESPRGEGAGEDNPERALALAASMETARLCDLERGREDSRTTSNR